MARAICEVEGCSDKVETNGFCKKHNYRYKKYGDPEAISRPEDGTSVKEKIKLYSEADPNTGCWLWTANKNKQGYGRLRDPSRGNLGAHVASYLTFVGEITEGEEVDHLCNNPSCINPEHLQPLTRSENLEKRGQRKEYLK